MCLNINASSSSSEEYKYDNSPKSLRRSPIDTTGILVPETKTTMCVSQMFPNDVQQNEKNIIYPSTRRTQETKPDTNASLKKVADQSKNIHNGKK